MSRFPILNHSVKKYSEFGNMLVSVTLEIKDKIVLLYATHFPKPTYRQEFHTRSMQFMSLAEEIKGQLTPVIVAGDFNATPYSPIFKKFLKVSGLKDTRTGFGWLPSWPTFFPLLWLPIDHILVSPDIQVYRRDTGPHIGSDHYPVFAELSIS
jgi:endonuclease/exonuclease/phosphatase (EEP) superfamily protein YafD